MFSVKKKNALEHMGKYNLLYTCHHIQNSCTNKLLGVIKCSDSWQNLSFQELKGCTTASAAMGNLVNSVVLLACCGSVTASDDGDSSGSSDLDDLVHHLLGAILKGTPH